AIDHRGAAGLPDFLDHGFGRRQRAAGAVARAAEIIDHDLGPAARQPQRMRAPETIARAGHDGDASVKPDCHALISFFFPSPLAGEGGALRSALALLSAPDEGSLFAERNPSPGFATRSHPLPQG